MTGATQHRTNLASGTPSLASSPVPRVGLPPWTPWTQPQQAGPCTWEATPEGRQVTELSPLGLRHPQGAHRGGLHWQL